MKLYKNDVMCIASLGVLPVERVHLGCCHIEGIESQVLAFLRKLIVMLYIKNLHIM